MRVAPLKRNARRTRHDALSAFHSRMRVAPLKQLHARHARLDHRSFHSRMRVAPLKPRLACSLPAACSTFHSRMRVAPLKRAVSFARAPGLRGFPLSNESGLIEAWNSRWLRRPAVWLSTLE